MKVFFDDASPCNDFVREVELLQYLLKKLEINVLFLKTCGSESLMEKHLGAFFWAPSLLLIDCFLVFNRHPW